ncbi:MAG TPA: beta-galactosidase [Bryobacteraceae bacterium]|nr:beta-galactosidase [Bryobacteraceae bacterium]
MRKPKADALRPVRPATGVAALLLAFAAGWAAPQEEPPSPPFVQAVEFPYYLCPANLWERQLVWLKSIGVRTVEFPIPWNWHQTRPGEFDFTGASNPRRDLAGFLKLAQRLGLTAWVRPFGPIPGWLNGGWPSPAPPGAAAQRQWAGAVARFLEPRSASHGGPVAYVEGRGFAFAAGPPPVPVLTILAGDPAALLRSRDAIAGGRGALLWRDVLDALYPAGWASNPALPVRRGVVSLAGEERPPVDALRRGAALLRNWAPPLAAMRPKALPKPAEGERPDAVRARELVSEPASALCISNSGKAAFRGDVRVRAPGGNRNLTIPGVSVPPGESLWLPVEVALGPSGLCPQCSAFSQVERIVYATEELLSVEYENGILAMEFAAPQKGEVALQLEREPVGPFLAAGKPSDFDWDEKAMRLKLGIPANPAPGNRVRIGIAVEEPDTAAFFNEAHRLLIGRENVVSTEYSSPEVAARSRLRLPPGFTAAPSAKSPNEIDYRVTAPPEAPEGDFADLALEADGLLLGRARLQLFPPAAISLGDAIELHLGPEPALTAQPPTATADPKGGKDLEIAIRNNSMEIQTYWLEASGDGLDILPAHAEISIGAMDQRSVSFRLFARGGAAVLRDWRLRVSGGAQADIPMRAVMLPRDKTVAWSADLDGDGSPEWVLESARARAVFSARDGGRWMEFTAKDSNANFLPEQGLFAAAGPVEVEATGDSLIFSGANWKRTVRLQGGALSVEQSTPLPPFALAPEKRGDVALFVERPSAARALFTLR